MCVASVQPLPLVVALRVGTREKTENSLPVSHTDEGTLGDIFLFSCALVFGLCSCFHLLCF